LKCVAFIRSVSLTYTNKDCNMYKKTKNKVQMCAVNFKTSKAF